MTAAGTLSTAGNVRTLDVGAGSILDFAAQNISSVAGTGLIKNGAGIYYSANGTQFTGGFTLNNGTVVMGGVNAMGGGAVGALNVNGGTIAASATRNVTGPDTQASSLAAISPWARSPPAFRQADGSATANISFADNVALGCADAHDYDRHEWHVLIQRNHVRNSWNGTHGSRFRRSCRQSGLGRCEYL